VEEIEQNKATSTPIPDIVAEAKWIAESAEAQRTLGDLLATKRQVVEMTEREYRDIISHLHDYEISDEDAHNGINREHIAQVCGNDRGYSEPSQSTLPTSLLLLLNMD